MKAEANAPDGVKGERSTWFTTPIGLEAFESQMESVPFLSELHDSHHPFRLLWEAVEPYTRADRNAFMAGLMICCGMWLSGRTKFAGMIDPHMYGVIVGTSSGGAKTTTLNLVMDVMEDVLPGFDKQYVSGLISTQEGLLDELQPAYIPDPSLPELPESTKDITRKLILLPELSVLNVVGSRKGNALNQAMRMAYDRSKQSTRVKKKSESLQVEKDAYVVGSLTNITPAELRWMVTDTEARNGSTNRYYMVWSQRSKDLYIPKLWNKEKDVKYQEAVKLLRDALQCTAKHHPNWTIEEDGTDDCGERGCNSYFEHFSKVFDDLDDSFLDSLQLRKQLFFAKICLILGATDTYAHEHCNDELMPDVVHDVTYIPIEDILDATNWIIEYENTIKHVFGNQKLTDLAQRILHILSAHEDHQMEMSKLHKQLGNNHKVVVINDAINQLIKADLAQRHTMHNGKAGRSAILIRLIAEKGEKRSGG